MLQDGDLINHWYIIALEKEIPKNRPIARTLYNKHFVIFRDNNQKVTVLEDRCIHRGATLSKGHCSQGHITCPYHGWTYNSEGQITEIPSEGPQFNAHRLSWKVPLFPVVVQDGCIWVWPGSKVPSTIIPPWHFPNFADVQWTNYFMITDFEDEVTRLVQNFMDVPHTVFVHSKWFRQRKLLKVPIELNVQDGRVKVTYQQPQDSIGFMEKILNPQGQPMFHTDEFIFPNLTRVDYQFGSHHFIINSQCSPISAFKTRVYTWISYRIGPLSKIIKPFMQYYTRKVIQQDVEIMKNVGNNFQRFGDMIYKSTAADELHLAIDRMRAEGKIDSQTIYQSSYRKDREFWI